MEENKSRTSYIHGLGAVLRVTGEDAASFLQGQFTNELQKEPGSVAYGLWLNQKGKVLADSHVLRVAPDEFWVVSASSPAAEIQARLQQYIIADDVLVTDETKSFAGLAVAGADERLAVVIGKLPEGGHWMLSDEVYAFAGRGPTSSYELLGPLAKIAVLHERLLADGFCSLDDNAAELARIQAGIPAVPMDIGPGDLPNEGGLEQVAISYTKGCYLGQEVMARLKNLGQVRRRLHVVHGEGMAPSPSTALYQGEIRVGELRSAANEGENFFGWAMLLLVNLNPDVGLQMAPDQPVTIKIHKNG